MESKQGYRPSLEIDFTSPKVIQCGGDLAQLENDDVVRSIGCGNTDKLSTFYENEAEESTKSTKKHDPNKNSAAENALIMDNNETSGSTEQ